MFPSTSGSPPQLAQGQARRKRSSGRYDSFPSLHAIASSPPINCTFFSWSCIATLFQIDGWTRLAQTHGGALAKDRGAYTNQGRAFLDRNHEVAGHPHREMRKGHSKFGRELIAQFPEGDEIFSRRFRVGSEWRYRHQAFNRQARQLDKRLHLRAQRIRSEPDLAPLARYVDF